MRSIADLVYGIVDLYGLTVFVYVLLTWVNGVSWVTGVRNALAPVVEPYIDLFRRFVPQTGALDFSPLIALVVLQVVIRGYVLPLLFGVVGL